MWENKNFCADYLTKFSIDLETQLRLVGVMNLILILSCPFCIQGRKPYFGDVIKNKVNTDLYSNIFFSDFFQTWYDDKNC